MGIKENRPDHLKVRVMDDIHCLDNFYSGVQTMDDFIHGGFGDSVRNHYCQAYVASSGDEIVAMFALSFDSLDLDSDDKEELVSGASSAATPQINFDYEDTFWAKPRYPALDIAYLAVSEKFRGHHIGRTLIEQIAERARQQTFVGCQFLTVEAYCTQEYSAVGFYAKCGFAASEIKKPYKDTQRMFKTLYS